MARGARRARRARGDGRPRPRPRPGRAADLHAWQSSFGSLDLQSTLVGHGRDLALQGLRLALEDGRPALAYEWSERARALVGRVAPVRPPADEQLAADLTELRVLHAADPSPHSAEARRLDELRDRDPASRAGTATGGGRVGEPAALDEVQAELAATDACLVAHVVVDGRITAVVVTGDRRPHRRGSCERRPSAGPRRGSPPTSTWPPPTLAGPFAAAIRGSLDERLRVVSDLLRRSRAAA